MLNFRLNKQVKALQEGLEWRNIPRLAIITGVNGVGKSQLLEVLNNLTSIDATLTDDGGHNVDLILNIGGSSLSVDGFLQYMRDAINRELQKQEYQRSLNSYESSLTAEMNKLQSAKDELSRARFEKNIIRYNEEVQRCRRSIKQLNVYAYDKELERLSKLLGKDSENITDKDIREYANPFFNPLTAFEDFGTYVTQEETERNKRYVKLSKEGREAEIAKVREAERSFQAINRLFKQFGFDYFEMLDPFPSDETRKGQILFSGKKGEIVEYPSLSSGEQMIVKFIIWAMGKDVRGQRINAMLIDEPDAHLHPSMCKIMVEILSEIAKPIDEGGSGVQVIITTHSPSTAAFAPEGSLFVMERNEDNNRVIHPTTPEESVPILSDGIFTFQKAMSQFALTLNSAKRNVLFVEGKTDVPHLNKAIKMLGYDDLDIDIVDMHDADTLSLFFRTLPAKLFQKDKLIALFDCDQKGKKAFDSIQGDKMCIPHAKKVTAEQAEGHSFAILIQPVKGLDVYSPIEFLYPKDFLVEHGVITKMNFIEYRNLYSTKEMTPEDSTAIDEDYKQELTLKPFKVNDSNKNKFAEQIVSMNDATLFEGFRSTIDLIRSIVDYGNKNSEKQI